MAEAPEEAPSKAAPSFVDWLGNVLTSFVNFLLWIFFGDLSESAGESASSPLEIQAIPGVTSLLDIALFRSVEAELTGTLNTSHALLQTWLQVQSQARAVLRLVKKHNNNSSSLVGGNSSSSNNNNDPNIRRAQLESFARTCYENSCHIVERMTTDRFAQTANLSDPYLYDSISNTTDGSYHHGNNKLPDHEFLLNATQDSHLDTGRRRLPVQQRPKDCWESPRLHCPDYVWGDDVANQCHKALRQLTKHPFCSATLSEWNASDGTLSSENYWANQQRGGGIFHFLSNALEKEESTLLLQLLLIDVSCRLSQFRAALEAESVVSKRLYLVKCEYRAPLRAFWEAHSSVQRAPSLKLVEEKLSALSATSKRNKSPADKDNLQKLLETPMLVELLSLERQLENYEVDMASALYPFCELARFLDQKKASVRNATPVLRETLSRLKSILVATQVRQRSHMSAGIRPLLLDFQGIPRDDEGDDYEYWTRSRGRRPRGTRDEEDLAYLQDPKTKEAISMRVQQFVSDLSVFAKQMSKDSQRKNTFYAEKKGDIDPPTASLCGKFDGELFKSLFEDWYHMAVKQHGITTARQTEIDGDGAMVYKIDALAEEIRRAEMAASMSMVAEPALKKVRERVRLVSGDRSKRFEILKESLEDLCLREMDLHVCLRMPPTEKLLELKPTNLARMRGVFGVAMAKFKQGLAIG